MEFGRKGKSRHGREGLVCRSAPALPVGLAPCDAADQENGTSYSRKSAGCKYGVRSGSPKVNETVPWREDRPAKRVSSYGGEPPAIRAENSGKRPNHSQDHDPDHQHSRDLVDHPIEALAARIAVVGKIAPAAHQKTVKAAEDQHQEEFELEPEL